MPGGFVPITLRTTTSAGSLSFTEGPTFRKNLEPFRLNGMLLYTYNVPGSESGKTTYPSDMLDARVSVEYVADDQRGLGFTVALVAKNSLPYRLDGHAVSTDFKPFLLIGPAVSVEYRLTPEWVASIGAQFALVSQNTVDAICPVFSMKYSWGGK